MSTKFIVKILIALALVVGIFAGAPQKGWQWFQSSSVGTVVYSWINGHENLSGLLKGPLEGAGNSNLTNTGIIDWTNNQRATQGLGPLHTNPLLQKAAEAKVADMFAKQYFEHKSPDGKLPSDLDKTQGYAYIMVGENLALGNFKDDETLVQAWMDSPGHRANILNNKYEEIGTAASKGMFEGQEVWLAVQEFGQPLSSCPSADTDLKATINANRSQLATLQTQLQQKKSEIDANRYATQADYEKAVSDYNALAVKINQLSAATQEVVQQYNDSVNAFNKCLESDS